MTAALAHPNDENVTVLSGSFNVGTGDKLDESKGTAIKAGGYSYEAPPTNWLGTAMPIQDRARNLLEHSRQESAGAPPRRARAS